MFPQQLTRYFLPVVLTVLILNSLQSKIFAELLSLSTKAEAAILMNADTGVILYEKNAHELHYPASITKIATALYALKKRGDQLDVVITADQEAISSVTEEEKKRSNYKNSYYLVPGSSHIGIKKGESLSLRDLLYCMMLPSAADASNVIAQHVGGTIPKFMDELNAYVKSIGCQHTVFHNPHGLHDPKQKTTAYDMALLTREALADPTFRKIVSTVRYTRPKTNKQEATTVVQSNKLLRTGQYYYPKAIGVKTGYLAIAQNTFVGAAKDGDRTLIAVLLKVPDRKDVFTDSVKMFEAAFNQPKVQRLLLKAGEQKFVLNLPGAQKPVATYTTEDITLEYFPAEEPRIKSLLYWDKLQLPISKNQRVGELVIETSDGLVKKHVPLFAMEKVKANWIFWFKSLFTSFKSLFKLLGFLSAFLLLTLFFLRLRRA